MNFLKGLYTTLVADYIDAYADWHQNYVEKYAGVKACRERLNGDPQSHLSLINDHSFIRDLFWSQSGATSVGSDFFSNEMYDALVGDAELLSHLESLIKIGSSNTNDAKSAYHKFEDRVKEIVEHRRENGETARVPWNRIHRIASTCSTAVSTMAKGNEFNDLWDWLITMGAITPIAETDWYSRNLALVQQLKEMFADELRFADEHNAVNGTIDEFYLNMFVWLLWENCVNVKFSLPQQMVKYGPPGTGKTFSAREEARLAFDIWNLEFGSGSGIGFEDVYQFQQFHPSIGYEDFLEGLRPVKNTEGKVELKLQNGLFKNFCKEAGKWEIDLYCEHLAPADGGSYLDKSVSELEGARGAHLSGPHWQYIFALPDAKKKTKLRYVLPPFTFVVDEVNRAELARVFGELMFCFEYRGTDGLVSTQYAMLNSDDDAMLTVGGKKKFFIPTNVRFVGTMNTIDRSVESFDFALRRRFKWQFVAPNANVLRRYLSKKPETWMPLAEGWESLNKAICDNKEKLGPNYQIGHAYLMQLERFNEDEEVKDIRWWIWNTSLKPLFEEYLRGDEESESVIEELRKKFF